MMISRSLSASGCDIFDQSQEKSNILIYMYVQSDQLHVEANLPYNCDTIEELEWLFYLLEVVWNYI